MRKRATSCLTKQTKTKQVKGGWFVTIQHKFELLDTWLLHFKEKFFGCISERCPDLQEGGGGSFEGHAGFDLPLAYSGYSACTATQTIWTKRFNSAHLLSSICIFSLIVRSSFKWDSGANFIRIQFKIPLKMLFQLICSNITYLQWNIAL